MGLFDFLSRKRWSGQASTKTSRKTVEHAQEIEKAVKLIQKNPLVKYSYDNELLEAMKADQQQLIVNQQLILDSVTVKDKKKGEIGLSDYLVSGSIFKDTENILKKAIGVYLYKKQIEPLKEPVPLSAKLNEMQTQLKELKSLLKEDKKIYGKKVKPLGTEKKEEESIGVREQLKELKEILIRKDDKEKQLQEQILALQEEKEKVIAPPIKKKETKPISIPALSDSEEIKTILEKPLKKSFEKQKKMRVEEQKIEATAKQEQQLRSALESNSLTGFLSSGFKKITSTFLKPERLFIKPSEFETFVEGNFSFKYPKWPPDINVSEDVILSVSSGPFGVELSAKEIYTLTFGAYVNKIITLIKTQLGANLLVQTIGVDSAYLEFVFKQGNLYWLYKAKVIECNGKFYTVAVKGLKDELSKIEKMSSEVLNSVKCEE